MKQYRLNRLFNAASQRCFDVAVDHGFFNQPGFLQGIEDMRRVVQTLVDAGPDAIQLTIGQARHLQSIPGKQKPALVLRSDTANVYGKELPSSAFSFMIEETMLQAVRLDASDEMAFALAHDKLASVHLNDQNGLKYDQDKNFGGANLRAAFNQVRVLEESGYGNRGEFIGLDVKAIRTQRGCPVTDHLKNSRELFLALVQKVRTVDQQLVQQYRDARDYEALELYILKHIMGLK